MRVALWRALHVLIDPPPHVLEDVIGLQLAAPDDGWQQRGDMHPKGTSQYRASIVARARLLEDLVAEQSGRGVGQYVILGAGLDTFAQRQPELASRLHVFEVDQPGTQAWKRQRLIDLSSIPDRLHLVPVNFEAGVPWFGELVRAGFDPAQPAVFASTGVSMFLTKDAVAATLRQIAELAPGTTLAMSFLLPFELAAPALRPGLEMAEKGARAAGTPFISFFRPAEMLGLARDCGFKRVEHISAAELSKRYFAGRSDGLHLPENTEELLVATT